LKKKWNQTEGEDGKKFKHGKFSSEEVETLKHSICQYVTVKKIFEKSNF